MPNKNVPEMKAASMHSFWEALPPRMKLMVAATALCGSVAILDGKAAVTTTVQAYNTSRDTGSLLLGTLVPFTNLGRYVCGRYETAKTAGRAKNRNLSDPQDVLSVLVKSYRAITYSIPAVFASMTGAALSTRSPVRIDLPKTACKL